MTEPPADIMRRLRPIPTYSDRPATRPIDLVGVSLDGAPRSIALAHVVSPVVLLFLSSDCQGCLELWNDLGGLQASVQGLGALVVVAKDPGEEDMSRLRALAAQSRDLDVEVILSSAAYRDYRAGAPFFTVLDADVVRVEGVAWGLEDTRRAVAAALSRD